MSALLKGALLSLMLIGSAKAEVVVIVNLLGPDYLSPTQVSKLYLGKSKHLPGQGKAYIIDMAGDSDIKREFHEKVTHKSASQLQAYWSRLIFTGKGKPPRAVRTPELILSLVGGNENAIGYSDESLVNDRVKIAYRP